MRYVKTKELAESPPGTIFSCFEPCITTGLYVVYGPISDVDFWYEDLIAGPDFNEPFDPAQGGDATEHPKLRHLDSIARWALYRPDDEFIIYDQADIARLVKCLTGQFKEVLGE